MAALGMTPRHWAPTDEELEQLGAAFVEDMSDPKPLDREELLKALERLVRWD